MNVSEIFIRRPVMTTLVMTGILLFGAMGYRLLPVSDLPNVDFPTLQVSAALPGASPETIAAAVATPLEKQFTTIAGLDSMSSSSQLGSTQITLQFNLSRSLDAAAQDVQAAIAATQKFLPRDMPAPPSLQKVNPADQPVIYMALSSDTLPLPQLDEYGETMMAQRISTISGVAQVQVFGAQKSAVRIQVNPQALAGRGIGIDEVAGAVAAGNVNLATGTLAGPHQAYIIKATGQLNSAADYRPLIVAYRNGAPVRLEELARVFEGVENDKTASWFSGTRAIVLAVQRQPGTNTVEVVNSIKALLPAFRGQLPASVKLEIVYDRSESIRDSVSDVKFTLLLTIALVILVIFLFLRNISATVIPSLALPLSIVGTFAVMYLLGYSLDNLSLMALTLSVGFVVDDAIVMLENIVRHMELGEEPLAAALKGSREIGFTILSMTISLAAVFIPVLFMGGILGRLFHEFAVTISVAILVSGFVSLTLTPMLCSRFLKPPAEARHGRFYNASERLFQRVLAFYERTLQWVLLRRRATLGFSLVLLIATGFLFVWIPKGFLPSDDISQIFGFTEAAQGISFDDMVKHQQEVARIIAAEPSVAGFMSSVGRFGASNAGIVFLHLKPLKDRPGKPGPDAIIARLRPQLARIPGIQVYLQNPPPIRIGGQLTKALYQVTLQAADLDELYRSAILLTDKLRAQPGFLDVNSDLQIKNPQVIVTINRDQASALGVSAQQIESALASAYGSQQISTIYAPTNQYQVILQVAPQYQNDPSALSLLFVRATGGKLVPLDAVTHIGPGLGPLTINHAGQLPAVTLSFNLKPGIAIGDAIAVVKKLARESLPASINLNFQGSAQAFQSSLAGLGLLLLIAILVIYGVLGILYESFIHPVTILSGLPSAGFGALLTLIIFRSELSVYAFVGIIMLVGIVKKNAIMMIDFALDAEKQGKSPADSIYEACRVRFRPIMMTTMAALMGTLPIALGTGAGANSRRPLGLAVVGGLVVSQFLTLYLTPVVYIYLDEAQHWLKQKWAGRKAQPAPQ